MGVRRQGKLPNVPRQAKRLKQILPRIVANEALNHFLEGFRRGGKQTDQSASGWAKRKRPDRSEVRRGRRAILVKTGALRNDIKVRRTTFQKIIISTLDTGAYASVHNLGNPARNTPQREFLGKSRKLDAKVVRLIRREMDKLFKR